MDGKERSACVHRGGHKTPNFRISLSFTNTLTTSITSESLPGSEQSSTAGTLSPSPMQSLGGGKMTITPPPPPEQVPHLGSHAYSNPILAMPRGCCRGPFSPTAKLTGQIVSPPRLQAGGGKAEACGRSDLSGTHAAHPFCLPLSLLPLTPSPPRTHPPRCLIQGWLRVLQVAAGMHTNLCWASR